jgi:hypothetical protein
MSMSSLHWLLIFVPLRSTPQFVPAAPRQSFKESAHSADMDNSRLENGEKTPLAPIFTLTLLPP